MGMTATDRDAEFTGFVLSHAPGLGTRRIC